MTRTGLLRDGGAALVVSRKALEQALKPARKVLWESSYQAEYSRYTGM